MKKIILFSVSVLFALILCSGVARAVNQASFKFTPASGTYQAGQSFPVDIQLNTDGSQIVAVSAYVLYDKTKLTAVSIATSTSVFAYEVENTIDSANGKIFITRSQPTPGVVGAAVQVARVNFQALTAVNPTNVSFNFISAGASGDSGAILNDGLGTDILTSVTNASFIATATTSPDIIAPSAPASLTAASTQTSATLSWGASTDAVGVVGYKVYRGNSQIATTTQLSYADSNLVSATSYSYGVSAYDAAGNESARSNVNITTQAANPPVILFIQAISTTNAATVSWLTDTMSDSQVEYGLTTAYGLATTKDSNLTLNHSQVISGLSPNTTYHYRVTSTDQNNNSVISQDYVFTTQTVPDTTPPTAITDLAISNIGQSSLMLSWTAPSDASGVTSYDIRYSTVAINDSNFSSATPVSTIPTPTQAGTSQQQYISVGLTPGTTYYFTIKSVDSLGNISVISNIPSAGTLPAPSVTSDTSSNNSGTISVSSGGGGGGFTIYQLTDSTPPASPSNLKAVASDAQIALSWSNPTDSDFVRTRILRKTNSYSSSQTDGVVIYEGNGSTFTDISLQNETAYYYTLYSYDSAPNFSVPVKISATPKQSTTANNTSTSQQQSTSASSSHLPPGISEGDLVRGPDGIKVYIVNYYGYKRHIFNPAIFNMYGHFKWDQIRTVDQPTLDSLKSSDFYRADSDTKVFSLKEIDEKQGKAQKRWMNFSGDKFTQLGFKWEQVFIINAKERDYYQEGTALTEQELQLTSAQQQLQQAQTTTQNQTTQQTTTQTTNSAWQKIGSGSLVKSADSPNIYYITSANLKKLIPTAAVFSSYGNKWENIKTVPQDQLNGYPTVNAIRLTGSTKVYFLENNTKRWVKSSSAFQRLNLDWNKAAQVNQTELDAYPDGAAEE